MNKNVLLVLAAMVTLGHGAATAATCESTVAWDIPGVALTPADIAENRDRSVNPYDSSSGFSEYNDGAIELIANVDRLNNGVVPNIMSIKFQPGFSNAPGCDWSGCGNRMWVVLRGQHKQTGATVASTYFFNAPAYPFPDGQHFFDHEGGVPVTATIPIPGPINPTDYRYYIAVYISRTSHPHDGTGLFGDIWPDYPPRIFSIELTRTTCTGSV